MRTAESNGNSFIVGLICTLLATALIVLPWLLNRDILK